MAESLGDNTALGLPLVEDGSSESARQQKKPRWSLLLFFVFINMLTYMDRGVIASDGVNGKRGDSHHKDEPPPRALEANFQDHAIDQASLSLSAQSPPSGSQGRGIQGDFNLSNFEDGLLQSAFMVGFVVASLIFAQVSKTYQGNPARLMGIGLLIFSAALVSCFFAPNYATFLASRAVVGVGEASFISLAAPVLDDEAPRDLRSVWLSIFYACISVGYAIGYTYGSFITQTLNLNWRYAFLSEAILISIPAIITTFTPNVIPIKSLGIKKDDKDKAGGSLQESITKKSRYSAIFHDLYRLFSIPVLVLNIMGYAMYTVTVGVYAYWGPKAVSSLFDTDDADFLVGAITAVSGFSGTLLGGYVLSKVFKGDGKPGPATLLCAGSTILSMGFALLSFGAFSPSEQDSGHHKDMQIWFYISFCIGQIFLFAVQGPTNAATIWAVESAEPTSTEPDDTDYFNDAIDHDEETTRDKELSALRPLSMAMTTLLIHLLGDVPSPPFAGLLQDNLKNWRTTFLIFTGFLTVPVIIWLDAWRRSKRQDRRKLKKNLLFD